jgi:phospholipid/cholesterol/gamma-HCH transport system ATP-binding protein
LYLQGETDSGTGNFAGKAGSFGSLMIGSPFKVSDCPGVMTEDLVRLENIVYRRGRKTIFDGLSLRVKKGQTVAIIGPSGTGKTTLLKLIGGQLRPEKGTVVVNGKDVAALSRDELFELRRDMGMLFQSGALFTDLTVFENVAFPLNVHTDISSDLVRDLVLIKLQAVGLRGASTLYPSELSGGMLRRVALARAMALDPALIMYDEPFTGLDPIAMGVIVELIKRVAEVYHTTGIIVSHDIQETASISDYIYLISDGRVIGEGDAGFFQEDQSPRVRQFMDGLPDGPVPFHYPATDYAEEMLTENQKVGWFNFD